MAHQLEINMKILEELAAIMDAFLLGIMLWGCIAILMVLAY